MKTMEKRIVIKFNKNIKEDLLVDLINSILRNLSYQKIFFFLDDVLIDKHQYYFIFSGDVDYFKILMENIDGYIKIKHYLFI